METNVRRRLRYGLALLLFLMVIVCVRSCAASFGYESEEVYPSPWGSVTIVLKYDFVSRPDVFRRGRLWDEKIWSYPNPGFMESVHFGVEWLSEDQIRLEYRDANNAAYDEEYIITIPH